MVAAPKRSGGRAGGAAARRTAAQARGEKRKACQDRALWAIGRVETSAERFVRSRRPRSPDRRPRSDAFGRAGYRGWAAIVGTNGATVRWANAHERPCKLRRIAMRLCSL